jgi:hypothetical protein
VQRRVVAAVEAVTTRASRTASVDKRAHASGVVGGCSKVLRLSHRLQQESGRAYAANAKSEHGVAREGTHIKIDKTGELSVTTHKSVWR